MKYQNSGQNAFQLCQAVTWNNIPAIAIFAATQRGANIFDHSSTLILTQHLFKRTRYAMTRTWKKCFKIIGDNGKIAFNLSTALNNSLY